MTVVPSDYHGAEQFLWLTDFVVGVPSEKSDTSSRRASGMSFRRCSRRTMVVTGDGSSLPVAALEEPPVGK